MLKQENNEISNWEFRSRESFKTEKVKTGNLTSHSPDGIKPWRAANEEKLIQKSVSAFGEISNKFAISSASYNHDGGMVFSFRE